MVRRRYTRVYRRVAKKKWCPILKQVLTTTSTLGGNTTDVVTFSYATLCQNAVTTGDNVPVPVPTMIKVKNFKCVLDIATSSATVARNNFYAIMYIPQGYTVTTTTPQDHPEWIMVWRTVDRGLSGTENTTENVQISSRLARNLNSGDSVILYNSFIVPSGAGSASLSINTTTVAYVSFVTCNN